jgi:hypothetical protein
MAFLFVALLIRDPNIALFLKPNPLINRVHIDF